MRKFLEVLFKRKFLEVLFKRKFLEGGRDFKGTVGSLNKMI